MSDVAVEASTHPRVMPAWLATHTRRSVTMAAAAARELSGSRSAGSISSPLSCQNLGPPLYWASWLPHRST